MLPDLAGLGIDGGLVRRRVGGELDLDRDGIEYSLACQHDLVMGRQTGKTDEAGFDLRRKDVDATNDKHVIVAPGHPHNADMGPATAAGFVDQRRNIARAIADHWQRFFAERRDRKLAGLAPGYPLDRKSVASGMMVDRGRR